VDPRQPQTLVERTRCAQDAFEPVGVCGGYGLQAIEADLALALAAVEGVERSADPLPSAEPALRRVSARTSTNAESVER
jgi:hypothetical protein